MLEILTRAGCFAAVIFLGWLLRKIGVFQHDDFKVLSKIVIKITLPAMIVTNFAGREIDPAMLSLAALGLGAGILYMALGYILYRRGGNDRRAFAMLNTSGYNVGNFTLPFVQSFLGPAGVVAASLFDVGNACVCFGGAYSVAAVVGEGRRFSLRRVGRALARSVPFVCYAVMAALNLAGVALPAPVLSFAGIAGNANAFLAMLMIGIGYKLEAGRDQIGRIVKILSVRYGAAVLLALAAYFLLPFDPVVRRTLAILAFSPIASAAPAFTAELKGDVGLASAINSISILCSIVLVTAALLVLT